MEIVVFIAAGAFTVSALRDITALLVAQKQKMFRVFVVELWMVYQPDLADVTHYEGWHGLALGLYVQVDSAIGLLIYLIEKTQGH